MPIREKKYGIFPDKPRKYRTREPARAAQPETSHAPGNPRLRTASDTGEGVRTPLKKPARGTKEIERKRATVSTIWKNNSFPGDPDRETGKFSWGTFIFFRKTPC
jgi:hypothetical protein